MRRFTIRLGIVALATLVALAIVELTLHAIRFEYHVLPRVQFGWPTPQEIQGVYRPEPDLFWVTKDFEEKLSYARKNHPAIVFLGDSCTEWSSYPNKTLDRLKERTPELASGVKFGIGGWSSEQGLRLLRRDILGLKPKVVTIYYGWNDHWVALGPTDSALADSSFLMQLGDGWRIPQLLLKARIERSAPLAERPNRVPIERYRANLTAMIRETRSHGIQAVLITPPSGHVSGREPEYLKLRHVRSLSEVVPLHAAYIAAEREVARKEHATLCDAADAFPRLPAPLSTFMRSDGIHLSELGDVALAEMLARCIESAARPLGRAGGPRLP